MADQLPTLPPELEPLRTELGVYYRELPQLLRDKEEGRYIVIKGEETYGTWDTFHDARQFGYLKFGFEPFLSQKIDARFLPLLEPLFGSTHQPAQNATAPATPVAEVA